MSQGLHAWFYVLYTLLTIGIFLSLYSFFHWRSGAWPSALMKLTVNFFIGLFLGKLLIAVIMLAGDIFLVLKMIFKFLFSFIEGKAAIVKGGSYMVSRSQFVSQIALLLGGLLTTGLVYGMTNRYHYKIRRVKVPLTGLPRPLKE